MYFGLFYLSNLKYCIPSLAKKVPKNQTSPTLFPSLQNFLEAKIFFTHFAHSTRELLLMRQSFLNIVIIYAVPQIQFHNKDSDLFLAGKSYAFSSQEGDRFEYLLHFSLLSNFSKQVLYYKQNKQKGKINFLKTQKAQNSKNAQASWKTNIFTMTS